MQRIVILIALLLATANIHAATAKLNLFIWSEYVDPAVVADFEKRHDCKVTLDFYEDEAAMMAKLQGGGAAQYDVIVPPDHSVPALIKLKLIAPLRHENIPNLRHIEERFASPWYDPDNRFTVPYQWGTVGIYMCKLPGKRIEETWGLFFDPRQQPGAFVLIDSMRDALGSALRYKGHSINSTSVSELAEARDLLVKAKKRGRGFEGGVGGKNKVLSKEVVAAIVFSGDAVRGMKEDTNTVYFIPKEGSQIWVDNLAICARAPNRVVAEKFLNFILDPEVGAKLADFNQYATPNRAAKQHVNVENLKNPAIYPDHQTLSRLEFLRDLGKNTRLYDEVWTQVKAR
ncbi:MAG TPA: spermidine/putrescine ABC transporter substrate-binding protein [Candidatus Acidoferrum sp.]|nr:spermidine/putrescine ABC transporter substrate-binding protein [Candidatus Acidoferrum sp.]